MDRRFSQSFVRIGTGGMPVTMSAGKAMKDIDGDKAVDIYGHVLHPESHVSCLLLINIQAT